jgi:hypothetical protein
MSPASAVRAVRTARALHRGPLPATAGALAVGEVSAAHAEVLAEATHELPAAQVEQAEGVLVEAARRLDPGRLRRLAGHLRELVDPDGSEARGRARWGRRGLWPSAAYDGMVALDGLLDAEAGETVRAALLPLARPAGPEDARSAAQRRADALGELARQGLAAGRLPQVGGVRPQLTVTVELASLLAAAGGVGGAGGWGGRLPAEAVGRLACDAVVTRAVVHRHRAGPGHPAHPGHGDAADPGRDGVVTGIGGADGGLAARLPRRPRGRLPARPHPRAARPAPTRPPTPCPRPRHLTAATDSRHPAVVTWPSSPGPRHPAPAAAHPWPPAHRRVHRPIHRGLRGVSLRERL